jgi:exoribonuclease R
MRASDDRAEAVERACAAAVTAATMRERVGETFGGSIVDVTPGAGLVQISDPPILAAVEGECVAGDEVTVELVEADVARRNVRFQVVGG